MELLSVDEVAGILGMHPRTVRRLLREGKLSGTKVGGEWRVSADSLKRHLTPERVKSAAAELLEGVPSGPFLRPGEVMAACAVVEVRAEQPQDVAPITRRLIDLINETAAPGGPLQFSYYFDQEAELARFVFRGRPDLLAKLLARITE